MSHKPLQNSERRISKYVLPKRAGILCIFESRRMDVCPYRLRALQ